MPPKISPELKSQIDVFLEQAPSQTAIDNFVYRLTLHNPEQTRAISEYVASRRPDQQLQDVVNGTPIKELPSAIRDEIVGYWGLGRSRQEQIEFTDGLITKNPVYAIKLAKFFYFHFKAGLSLSESINLAKGNQLNQEQANWLIQTYYLNVVGNAGVNLGEAFDPEQTKTSNESSHLSRTRLIYASLPNIKVKENFLIEEDTIRMASLFEYNQKSAGSTAADYLLWGGSVPNMFGLPALGTVIRSNGGYFFPWELAHTVAGNKLSLREHTNMQLTLRGAQAVENVPSLGGWLGPVIVPAIFGEGDGTPFDTRSSQLETLTFIIDDLTSLLNDREIQRLLGYYRGNKMGAVPQMMALINDTSTILKNMVRMNSRASVTARVAYNCRYGDKGMATAYMDPEYLKVVEDETSTPEEIKAAQEKVKEKLAPQANCDAPTDFVSIADRWSKFSHLSILARANAGTIIDQTANNGVLAGVASAVFNLTAVLLTARAISQKYPKFRWSLAPLLFPNPDADSHPPLDDGAKIGEAGTEDAVRSQAMILGVSSVAAFLAMKKFKWVGRGSRFDPHVHAAFSSAIDDVLRVPATEEFLGTMLNNSEGSELATGLIIGNSFFRLMEEVGDGYADANLLRRIAKNPSTWQGVQFALLMATRVAAKIYGGIKVAETDLFNEDKRSIQWGLYGGEIGAYAAGWGLYFGMAALKLLIPQVRDVNGALIDLDYVSMGDPNGDFLTITPNPDSPKPFKIGVTPEVRSDGLTVNVGFTF